MRPPSKRLASAAVRLKGSQPRATTGSERQFFRGVSTGPPTRAESPAPSALAALGRTVKQWVPFTADCPAAEGRSAWPWRRGRSREGLFVRRALAAPRRRAAAAFPLLLLAAAAPARLAVGRRRIRRQAHQRVGLGGIVVVGRRRPAVVVVGVLIERLVVNRRRLRPHLHLLRARHRRHARRRRRRRATAHRARRARRLAAVAVGVAVVGARVPAPPGCSPSSWLRVGLAFDTIRRRRSDFSWKKIDRAAVVGSRPPDGRASAAFSASRRCWSSEGDMG